MLTPSTLPRRRRLAVSMLVFVALALAVHGAREVWRAYRWASADPWPAEAPVTWTVSGRHVAAQQALVERVRPHLLAHAPLAVTGDPALGNQAEYLYRWWAYLMPERDVRRTAADWAGVMPQLWLAWDAPVEEGTTALETRPYLTLDPAGPVLYRVRHPPRSTKAAP